MPQFRQQGPLATAQGRHHGSQMLTGSPPASPSLTARFTQHFPQTSAPFGHLQLSPRALLWISLLESYPVTAAELPAPLPLTQLIRAALPPRDQQALLLYKKVLNRSCFPLKPCNRTSSILQHTEKEAGHLCYIHHQQEQCSLEGRQFCWQLQIPMAVYLFLKQLQCRCQNDFCLEQSPYYKTRFAAGEAGHPPLHAM